MRDITVMWLWCSRHRTRMLDELDGVIVEEDEDADDGEELAWNLLDAAAADLSDRVDELLDLVR